MLKPVVFILILMLVTVERGGADDSVLNMLKTQAAQGDAKAQLNLGILYDSGQGVPRDYVQAHMWLNLATSRFPAGANYDRTAKARDAVAAKMTPAQLAEAQKLAQEWKLTSAKP